jgi:hypothetical protein
MANSNALTNAISKRLSKHRLFYVCRDLERATGSHLNLKNFFIITNKTRHAEEMAAKHTNIFLITSPTTLDTSELLESVQTKKIIQPKDFILVFKNNVIIEKICQRNSWRLLNPPAHLAETVESKITQITWLGRLAKYLPPHDVHICEQIPWQNQKFILQFNHSHTGGGTFLIDTKSKLNDLKNKFPKRPVRTMTYIKGPVFTNNNLVWGNKIFIGNISYQITGIPPFTNHAFATVGNDWGLPHTMLSKKQLLQYNHIVRAVGTKLKKNGWKGLFGVDVIQHEKTGQLYLLEINARQPASTTFESELQSVQNPSKTTLFDAHLAALLGIVPQNKPLTIIQTGAQIVQRVTATAPKTITLQHPSILHIIYYPNTALGSDLIRIQCNESIMKKHNKFNSLGTKISKSIC